MYLADLVPAVTQRRLDQTCGRAVAYLFIVAVAVGVAVLPHAHNFIEGVPNCQGEIMFSEARKAWVAGVCAVLMIALDAALTELELSSTAQGWIKVVGVVLSAVATYIVPNSPPAVTSERHRL